MNKIKSVLIDSVKSPLTAFLLIASAMSGYLFIVNPNFGGDSIRFLVPMQNFLEGKGYTVNGELELLWSPGYGFLSMMPYVIFRDLEYAGMLVSLLSYLSTVALVYHVTRTCFGREAAFIAGYAVTFFGVIVNYSIVTLADVTYTAFLMITYLLFLRSADSESLLQPALAGLFAAVGGLVRPDLFIIAVIICGYYFACVTYKLIWKKRLDKLMLLKMALFAGVYFLVSLPYCLFLYKHSGNFTVSNKFTLAAIGGAEVATEWTIKASVNPIVHILKNLASTLVLVKKNIFLFMAQVIAVCFYIIAPAGLMWLTYPFVIRKRIQDAYSAVKWRMHLLAVGLFFFPMVPCLLYDTGERYIMPYLVLITPLVSAVLAAMIKVFSEALRISNVKCVALFLIVSVMSLFVPVPNYFNHFHWNVMKVLKLRHGHLGHRAAGEWLYGSELIKGNIALIAPDKSNVVLFYANNKHEPKGRAYSFRYAKTMKEVIDYMRKNNIRYMLLERHYSPQNIVSAPVWENPLLGNQYGLHLTKEEKGMFQFYELRSNNENSQ